MKHSAFPVIDLPATGENILRLRKARGLSVRDLQDYFGFEQPQAIYKWQSGQSLPSVDNLYALGALLEVPMDSILIPGDPGTDMTAFEQQAEVCCSNHFLRLFWIRQGGGGLSVISARCVRRTAFQPAGAPRLLLCGIGSRRAEHPSISIFNNGWRRDREHRGEGTDGVCVGGV